MVTSVVSQGIRCAFSASDGARVAVRQRDLPIPVSEGASQIGLGEQMSDDQIASTLPYSDDVYVSDYGILINSHREQPAVEFAVRRIGSLVLLEVCVDHCQFVKVPGGAALDWAEMVLLVFATGEGYIRDKGSAQVTCAPGDIFLFPMRQGHSLELAANSKLYAVFMAKDNPVITVSRLLPHIGKRIQPSNPFPVRMLSSYIRSLVHESVSPEHALKNMAERHLAELISLICSQVEIAGTSAKTSSVSKARINSLLSYVNENIHNPNLSVSHLADALSISSHYIRKLFYLAETNFSEYLTESRLNWAYQRLTSVQGQAERIADIAFQAGFNNLGWFNRAFKKKFGVTPSLIRKKARDMFTHGARPSARDA